jgi:GTP cyclohydrolase I
MSYKLVHQYDPHTTEGLASAYRNILGLIGEDPDREGLLKTPERVAKAMQFLTQGMDIDPVAILQSARFEEQVAEMVVVKDIEMYSMCEHHMIPFFGKAHVAYIPNGYITGLSKMARVVDACARRLQVQERLTMDIAQTLESVLKPKGVGVVVEAKHLCMMMRGVEKQNSVTTTSAFDGAFQHDVTRSEFLRLISSKLS